MPLKVHNMTEKVIYWRKHVFQISCFNFVKMTENYKSNTGKTRRKLEKI